MTRDDRQQEAKQKWFKHKGIGTYVFCTGFGKTRTALLCLKSVIDKYPNTRFLVVVPTDTLKVQWQEQLEEWNLSTNGMVEIINTVIKREYDVDILCIDEVHRVAADTFQRVFETVHYKYVLGLTATYERLDGKHKTVLDKYCPVIDTVSLEDALLNNWISPYKEYQVLIDVDDINIYKQYDKEFQEHLGFFNYDWTVMSNCVGKDGWQYRNQLCKERCNNDEHRKEVLSAITYHSVQGMSLVHKRKTFINNHPKKLEIARRIIAARPNAKIITFSNNIKMAEAIGVGIVYTGKDSKKHSRNALAEFNQMKSGILNSVAKLNEGMDCPNLNIAIMLGIDSSQIKATQRIGRVCRFEVGKQAEIFNLIINNTVETSWFAKSHAKAKYITIDEQGLDDVLNGREPKPYVKPIKDFTFRF